MRNAEPIFRAGDQVAASRGILFYGFLARAIHQSFIFPTIGPSAVKHGSYNHIADYSCKGWSGGVRVDLLKHHTLQPPGRKGKEWRNINEFKKRKVGLNDNGALLQDIFMTELRSFEN